MKIALLQLNVTVGDLAGNARRIEQAARDSAKMGAQLAVTSELALLGYPPRDLLLDRAVLEQAQETTNRLARSLDDVITLLLGTVEPNLADRGRSVRNVVQLLKDGNVRAGTTKVLLPTYDVFDEDRYFEPGAGSSPLQFAGTTLGLTICEDVWNDAQFWPHPRYHQDPVEALAGQVQALINLSASPFHRGKQVLRERMLGHTARRHGKPVLYVNQVGGNDELIFDGRSCAFDALGQLLGRAQAFREDVLLVNLPSEGEPVPGRVEPDLAGEEEVWHALVLGTRDYAHKCGFKQGIVALSGGIDSALTAAVVCAALGPANVVGVMMPSPYSSPGSLDDSARLAGNLGIETLKLPIEPAMQAIEQVLAPAFAGMQTDVTEENIQARIRGTLVMALSNKFNRLVFITGNKSETAVGYNTLYGCTAGALAVIADLYKGEVYRLAYWLNRNGELIPEDTLTKPPSAELRPDQRDQDTLPAYDVLDAILYGHIEAGRTSQELIEAGNDPQTVHRVLKLLRQAEFKRRQLPPALKVSARAFGMGWRMPIARL